MKLYLNPQRVGSWNAARAITLAKDINIQNTTTTTNLYLGLATTGTIGSSKRFFSGTTTFGVASCVVVDFSWVEDSSV